MTRRSYYKKGEILQPNLGAMKSAGLRLHKRLGEFMGYTKDGHFKIRPVGIRAIYVYHPSFWRGIKKKQK